MCDRTPLGSPGCLRREFATGVRILYDIYHMQVMEGDVIQTIRDNHQWFAHYHTAGVPGRNELDDTQELNYPCHLPRNRRDGLYSGYIGQEFVPTGEWKASLRGSLTIFAT